LDNFSEIIKASDTKELASEYLEVGLDELINIDAIKDLPIVNTISSVYKLKNAVSDAIFLKKIIAFLKQIHTIPTEKTLKEIEKINNSKKYANNVGEKIIEILERIDSEKKPEIIGKLFKHFLSGQYDYEMFLRLSHIVERVFYYDLLQIQNYDENNYIHNDVSSEMHSYGLCSSSIGDWVKPDPTPDVGAEITEFGKLLVTYGLK
jgi:hypothetical protein